MKYSEVGFRAFYHNLCAITLRENLRFSIENCPHPELANCILVYGYIDCDAGMTLEVLASGEMTDEGCRFFDLPTKVRSFIRAEAIMDDEAYYFPDEAGTLHKRFEGKIKALDFYNPDNEVEETRKFAFLDGCRNNTFPDDILVYLLKDGLNPEGCWVRIIGIQKPCICGKLLTEPDQDFGFHEGDTVAFFIRETEDKKIICCSDMNPDMKLTPEDLAGGQMLKDAIVTFEAERNNDNFISILELLRDSYVWIPCNTVVSEKDQQRMLKAIEDAGGDPQAIVGSVWSNEDVIRLVPDILKSGDSLFFPVFSSAEEMGEYGNGFSKVEKHFLEAISMARHSEKEIKGIVVNAFSTPFVLETTLFDLVEKCKSRLVEPEQ